MGGPGEVWGEVWERGGVGFCRWGEGRGGIL